MLVHETQDLTVVEFEPIWVVVDHLKEKRSHNVRFAFEMNSNAYRDERSLPTMRLSTQSANQRFTQDGLYTSLMSSLFFLVLVGRNQTVSRVRATIKDLVMQLRILSHERHGLYLHPSPQWGDRSWRLMIIPQNYHPYIDRTIQYIVCMSLSTGTHNCTHSLDSVDLGLDKRVQSQTYE